MLHNAELSAADPAQAQQPKRTMARSISSVSGTPSITLSPRQITPASNGRQASAAAMNEGVAQQRVAEREGAAASGKEGSNTGMQGEVAERDEQAVVHAACWPRSRHSCAMMAQVRTPSSLIRQGSAVTACATSSPYKAAVTKQEQVAQNAVPCIQAKHCLRTVAVEDEAVHLVQDGLLVLHSRALGCRPKAAGNDVRRRRLGKRRRRRRQRRRHYHLQAAQCARQNSLEAICSRIKGQRGSRLPEVAAPLPAAAATTAICRTLLLTRRWDAVRTTARKAALRGAPLRHCWPTTTLLAAAGAMQAIRCGCDDPWAP